MTYMNVCIYGEHVHVCACAYIWRACFRCRGPVICGDRSLRRSFFSFLFSEHVYVGVGEWCGVTGLFAAQLAKKAILVEPDPHVLPELRSNVAYANGVLYMYVCM